MNLNNILKEMKFGRTSKKKMTYKKMLSLFAVSTLALAACGADNAEETDTENTEDETEEVKESEESSTKDLIEQAKGESGTASPEYGLEVSGNWTVDGYVINHTGSEATIPVAILTKQEDYNVYLLEDSMISEIVSNEEEIEFLVENPTEELEYHVGVSPEDLGAVGDEVSVEDFERYEHILFEEVAE